MNSSVATMPRGDDQSLTDDELDALHRQLLDTLARLEARARVLVATHTSFDASSAARSIGETEHTAIDIERHVSSMLHSNAIDAMREIDDALLRIATGTYGRCEQCDTSIAFERLEARPTARLCIDCQRVVAL